MNLNTWLKKNGIKVSVIKHDINKKFGRFDPLDYKPKEILAEKGCHVIKFSYPAMDNKCVYNTEEGMDGLIPDRYSGDKWCNSIEVTQRPPKYGVWEGMIQVGKEVYPEEVLWWFYYGVKPTAVEAIQNIFSEFGVLEELFGDYSFDETDTYQAIKLWKFLEMGEQNSWDERERQLEVWHRLDKLRSRIEEPYGLMYSMDSTGIGRQKFEQLKQLL